MNYKNKKEYDPFMDAGKFNLIDYIKENKGLTAYLIFMILFACAMIYYSYWQYGLCMEKFDDFWYCLKHAM